VGSTTKRNKNKQREFVFKTKSNRGMVLQKTQLEENNNKQEWNTSSNELEYILSNKQNNIEAIFQQ
jgi:hypothetical protein